MSSHSNESHWFVILGTLLLLASTWFGAGEPVIQGQLVRADGTTISGHTVLLLDQAQIEEAFVRSGGPDVDRVLAAAPQAMSNEDGVFRIPYAEVQQPVLCVLHQGVVLAWVSLCSKEGGVEAGERGRKPLVLTLAA